jgi:hypothetical protein
MPFRNDSLKPYKGENALTARKQSRRPSYSSRPTLFERDVYADISGIDPDVYEAELREADELYRASRNLDPNRPRKREEDMTDQDYSDMSIDEYRAAVASGQYDRHLIRQGTKPARVPVEDINMEFARPLPGGDEDYAERSRGGARRAVLSGQYGRDMDMDMDRRRSTVSRRSRMPSVANGSGSTSGGSSNRLGIRGSIKQAIVRKLGDPK